MKKLSVMAVVVAATCMLAACGKLGTVNPQAAGESQSYESTENVSSEAQESTASQEGISESGKSKEEQTENACTDAEIIVCLLDEDGLVIGVGADYISELGEGESYGGTISVYGDKKILALTKGVAMFANPYTAE